MKKVKVNYFVDLLLVISGLISIVSGVIMFFAPSGPGSSLFTFLGVTKHSWGEWHKWSGMTMAVLVILHFILHWKWFIAMTKNLFHKR
jgi:hypothetical protein